jgi:protein CpxP
MSKLTMKQVLKSTLMATVLAGAALAAQAQPMGHGRHGGHEGPGLFGVGRIEHMLEAVDATDAQRAQIKQIMQNAMQDLKGQRDAGRNLHEQALALFAAPVIDANAVEALRQQMAAQHEARSKRMSQALVEASRVLTPEQRAKFVERMKKRHARMAEHLRERGAPASK